mmetsp:Transcript_3026/g.12448  ORF Transcript_3026/g.12448 Transcript_3026/m.12448 type:complete len:205 (+) Transcript_3026:1641-2255(+)
MLACSVAAAGGDPSRQAEPLAASSPVLPLGAMRGSWSGRVACWDRLASPEELARRPRWRLALRSSSAPKGEERAARRPWIGASVEDAGRSRGREAGCSDALRRNRWAVPEALPARARPAARSIRRRSTASAMLLEARRSAAVAAAALPRASVGQALPMSGPWGAARPERAVDAGAREGGQPAASSRPRSGTGCSWAAPWTDWPE